MIHLIILAKSFDHLIHLIICSKDGGVEGRTLIFSCEGLGVSGGGAHRQWPVVGSETLMAAVLGGAACRRESFWRRVP